MIHELQQTFHSIIKSLEVLYVIEGAKPCTRILVFEEELGKAINFFNAKNLKTSISDFKVLKLTIQTEFYSDKSIKIPKDDARKGYFFVYLSKYAETAEKARLAEEKNDHSKLGLLLGYPKCCCDFFEKKFNEKNTDLTLEVLENSNGFKFPFYSNIAARHFDVALLSHFPHSFDCEHSIKIAKENLGIISSNSRQLSELFAGILQRLVVYTLEEGVFLLRAYEMPGNDYVYDDILTTTKSKLNYLLSSNKKLKMIGKNSFTVNDAVIQGKKYGIMAFN